MNQQLALVFCKKCQNQKFNIQKGLVCNLTGESPNFDNKCDSFSLDPKQTPMPFNDINELKDFIFIHWSYMKSMLRFLRKKMLKQLKYWLITFLLAGIITPIVISQIEKYAFIVVVPLFVLMFVFLILAIAKKTPVDEASKILIAFEKGSKKKFGIDISDYKKTYNKEKPLLTEDYINECMQKLNEAKDNELLNKIIELNI